MAIATEANPFEAWWETSPCPSWCEGGHAEQWHLEDCNHLSHRLEIPARLMGGYEPSVHVELWQNIEDSRPHLLLYGDRLTGELKLTPGEAGLLAEQLRDLLREVSASA